MAQTAAQLFSNEGKIDHTPGSAVIAGQVIVIGTIPMVAEVAIAANALGSLTYEGLWKVPKTTDTFTAGDAVYWNTTGTPVTGDASSGAADSSSAAGNLMGFAAFDAATGDTYVTVGMTAAKRTATLAGSVTADDITGGDSSLGVNGLASTQGGAILATGGTSSTAGNAGGAVGLVGGTPGVTGAGGAVNATGGIGGATSGLGGAIVIAGGAGTNGNSAGGAVSATGGAGQGSAAGGLSRIVGGAGGATGAGGAAQVTGGAGGASSGTGGAVTIAAGAGTAGNADGGALTINAGAKNGSGADGAITIGSTAASITLGKMPRIPTATVAAAGTVQGDAAAIVEGFTLVTGSTNAGVKLPLAVAGMQVIVKNNVAGNMKVWPGVGDAINAIAVDNAYTMATVTAALFVAYDSTTWYSLPLVSS